MDKQVEFDLEDEVGKGRKMGIRTGIWNNMTKVKDYLKGCIKTEYSRNIIKFINIFKESK